MKNYEYLKDTNFLNELFSSHHTSCFANIIILNWEEQPIQEIQSKVINGSFNIDGNSLIRRTANINVLIEEFDVLDNIDSFFSINKKVNIELGLKNTTEFYLDYDIIWFPMGFYIIQNVSFTRNLNNLNLQLQLKDKMCLLNGECGGVIPAATVFDSIETIDQNGSYKIKKTVLYQLIQQLVNHFGKQPLAKIIISDIDLQIKQVMRWTGSAPLYILTNNSQWYVTTNPQQASRKILAGFHSVVETPEGGPYGFQYGDDIGYIYTDFVYPDELISDVGNSVCDILNKITSILTNYEYYFDVFGFFIFQEKKNYINNSQIVNFSDKIKQDTFQIGDYILDLSNGKSVYEFNNSNLIISYGNNPQYNMVKNDFIVWGQNKVMNKTIRYHLAIDKKPKIGNTYRAVQYKDPNDGIVKWTCPLKFNLKSDFPEKGAQGVFYFATNTAKLYIWKDRYYQEVPNAKIYDVTTKDWRTQLYFQGVMAEPYGLESNDYYAELKNQWPLLYDIKPDDLYGNNYSSFRPEVLKYPSQVQYFLDFIDTDSKINNFSVNNIGRRTYAIVDDKVNCVFEPAIPDIVLINNGDTERNLKIKQAQNRHQNYYVINENIYNLLEKGGILNSAYQHIRQLLHQYTSYNENINLSCIPLYFLQPNTRISIKDARSGIYGDYMISNMSINLGAKGSMNINAIKALEKV